ncbi:hypothetical protein HMPREF1325_0131 [Treponema socranskii subsp. socranskii VPI DR56BR1116 = ATCC 35536]|uniref:Bacterial repeat domain-containing protein n=3 Tax=Treponema socranskii TaxID=53419 RepID=U1F9S9_TRESO|nr:hypothetical protein HMPREF1325_0131 [Treponema socranskii subsp. socranskii VPI DR56BR1116 = ATCC 35536]
MNKVKSTPVRLYRGGGGLGKALLKKVPIAAAGVLLFAAALVFTSCSNDSDSAGTPKHAVTFSVEGGNGTIKATVGGTEINSGDTVEQGKIVEFTATPDNPATHNVDFWTVSAGAFEEGTGTIGSTSAKLKVAQPVTVTVKFKLTSAPPTKVNVTFGVSGTGGTLKAEVEGVKIISPAQVEKSKTVVFTAEAALGYAVEKWTDGGTDIAGETNATYNHTVTANADIAVHFKTAPVDVYVTGTRDNKPYVWKNGVPTQLSAHEAAPDDVCPYAVRSRGKDVYIAGKEKNYGIARPLVWKKDGSLHWIGNNRWSSAYDIAFYKGKTLVAGKTYDGTDSGASITDISDPGNPAVTFLYKVTSSTDYAEACALCTSTDTLYAAGYKRQGSTEKAFLWTLPDGGTMRETELGPQGEADYSYDVCTAGASVYVAAGNLWKVEGGTVTPISVSGTKGVYALCVHDGTVYAAGWTNASRAAVWKIEGTSASLYKELSTVSGGVYALCAAGGDLYAAGFYLDTDYKNKPVWWHIAADGTVTENKLGTEKGEARGICVTAQE